MRAFADMRAVRRGNGEDGARLKSWKEIAAFFGTDERTARRWERRGLPVQRVPGGGRSTVYADAAELQAWLQGRRGQREEPTAAAEVPRRGSARRWGWQHAAAALLLLAGSTAVVGPGTFDPSPSDRRQPSREALDLYLAGTFHSERRTPDSLRRAVALFGRSISEDPGYAEPYAGLASAWLLLREFGDVPDAEAYGRASDAAERALSLDRRLAPAHLARAFIAAHRDGEWARAIASFERAIALDPESARARHWYATALLTAGRFEAALQQIDAARRLDPQSRAILADRGLILFYAGRAQEGVAILQDLAASQPDFVSPHSYLATIHAIRGEHSAFLHAAGTAARIRGQQDRVAMFAGAEAALLSGGEAAMWRSLLARQVERHGAGRESAYAVAVTLVALDRRREALRLLETSARAREPEFLVAPVDPMLRSLRGDPAFLRLTRHIGRGSN